MIAQETINAILDRADIVDVVRERVPSLTKRGTDWVACCPFHSEKTPSFHVSPARQTWHCFGACAEGGNVISFVMKADGLTFPQAVQRLAERYGIDFFEQEESNEERERRLKREAMWGLNERAAAYFAERLYSPEGKRALDYAVERFGEDYVRESGMGFADGARSSFTDWAMARGENVELLLETNLVGCNVERGYYYDFFRDRLIFPIRDRAGHVLGFTARDLSGENDCKYLNSKESEAYHKKESVFGIDVAWRTAAKQELFYLVEGAPDAAKMQAVGIANAVAPLGGMWTKEQLSLLRCAADCVCFINDADPPKNGEQYGAGIQFVMKNGRMALEMGFSVSVREMPLGKGQEKQDPGSYFSAASKLDLLKEEEFVLWCANKWWRHDDNSNRKTENLKRIAELASHIKDETRLEMLLAELVKLNKGKEQWRALIRRAQWARMEAAKAGDPREVNLRKYGFCEEHGCYYGLTDKGDVQWSNFTMRPLFHILDDERPRRLYEIKGAGSRRKQLVDMDMEELISIAKFRKKLEGLGNYIWKGNESDMITLKTYLYENTDSAKLIKQMGWNSAGFYAWGNGVYVDGAFRVADEYGIVATGEGESIKYWFIPAAARTADAETYERQRNFIHRSLQRVKFGDYMRDFVQVNGDNGKIGLCYWIASIFRDIVTTSTRSFPILNLFGQPKTGKTEFGAALMAFFIIDNKAPNLKNSTPIALNDDVAYSSNALVHFDEYKNDIHPKMIEFLKGLYDGVGRTKMGGDAYSERKMTSVKSGIIVSGQEMPTADIALFSRCVFLPFTRTAFSLEEQKKWAQLVQVQKNGLTNLTLEVLDQRKRVQAKFLSTYAKTLDDIARIGGTSLAEPRIIENWAKCLAAFRCVEDKLPFPFTYEDVLNIAIRGISKQNQLCGEGNELSHFWNTIMYLRDNGDIFERADYTIKRTYTIKTDACERTFKEPREVLLLNTSRIFQQYKESARKSGDKVIPDNSLREYMKNCGCYLGVVKAVRFISMAGGYENKRQEADGTTRQVYRVTRAMAFDYELLKEKYGINLESLTTSFEKSDDELMTDEETTAAPAPKQRELPF